MNQNWKIKRIKGRGSEGKNAMSGGRKETVQGEKTDDKNGEREKDKDKKRRRIKK